MLSRTTASLALALSLGFAGSASAAPVQYGSTQTFNVCGGSYTGYTGFGLCASVNVGVWSNAGNYYLTFQVYNMSGSNGSYSGSAFTRIGLDNVVYNGVNVNAVLGTLAVTGPCATNPSQQCSYTNNWQVQNDKTSGGGINVDLLNITSNGVNNSVVSSCIQPSQVPASGNVITTSCSATAPLYATFTFQITAAFDPTQVGNLYIMAQNGYNGQSTFCSTGANANCGTIVVPEPVSLALFGSGFAALGIRQMVRRRRRESDADVTNG